MPSLLRLRKLAPALSLRRIRRLGFAIGSILLLAMVVMLVCVSICALSTYQISAAKEAEYSRDALFLGDAVVSQVVSKIQADHTFGTIPSQSMTYSPAPDRFAVITFDNSGASGPFSTNNLTGTSAVGYPNFTVPLHDIHLLANAQSHSIRRQVEVMVNIPPYPYVLSCQGDLNADQFTVAGAADMGTYVQNTPGATLPASVAGNGNIKTTSSGTTVTGNLYFGNSLSLTPTASVSGRVEQKTVIIPTVTPALATQVSAVQAATAGLSPLAANTGAPQLSAGNYNYPGGLSITGTGIFNDACVYVGSDLTGTGDLILNHSLVFVAGNITLPNGGLSGSGAVVCTGFVQMLGANLDAFTEVALLAGGNVNFTGGNLKFFQGLVYTEGNFKASYMTIAGTFIAAGPTGSMSLTHVTVVHIPGAADLNFTTSGPTVDPVFGSTQTSSPSPMATGTASPGPANFEANDSQSNYSPTNSYFTATQISQINNDIAQAMAGNPSYVAQEIVTQGLRLAPMAICSFPPGAVSGQQVWQMVVDGLYYNPMTNQFEQKNPPTLTFEQGNTNGYSFITEDVFEQQAEIYGTTTQAMVDALQQAQAVAMQDANSMLNPTPNPTASILNTINLDLNQFLGTSAPLHIASYRTH